MIYKVIGFPAMIMVMLLSGACSSGSDENAELDSQGADSSGVDRYSGSYSQYSWDDNNDSSNDSSWSSGEDSNHNNWSGSDSDSGWSDSYNSGDNDNNWSGNDGGSYSWGGWHDGGGGTSTSVTGDPEFTGQHFSGSENCAGCHNDMIDNTGKDVSIVDAWETSMMANSARDPYWRAKVASELYRHPHLSDVINDKCSRCHAPMANVQAERDAATKEILGTGFLSSDNSYFDEAMDGVSCTLCHQIEDDGLLGTLEGVSGHFSISTETGSSRPAYGQYTDVSTWAMRRRVNYTPQFAAHISRSETCATCHDLKTPYIDAQGVIVSTTPESEFPEQMPFTEWKNSDFRIGGSTSQNCQDCHMPKTTAPIEEDSRPRSGFAEHSMLGANSVMMDILNNNREALGVRASSAAMNAAILRTREFLGTAASIEIVSTNQSNNQLLVQVQVKNHTGHKLPTAYPSRRVWIHFRAEQNGVTIFESGALQADGSIEGVAVDENYSTYEPHYDLITSLGQVQVYEPIMGNTENQVNHGLLRASQYLKDNRIPPSGFDKQVVPADIAVHGNAANDSNFNDGSDTVTYSFSVGSVAGISIQANLMYQPLSFGHLQELFQDQHLTEVAHFKTMFENRNILAETLATHTYTFD